MRQHERRTSIVQGPGPRDLDGLTPRAGRPTVALQPGPTAIAPLKPASAGPTDRRKKLPISTAWLAVGGWACHTETKAFDARRGRSTRRAARRPSGRRFSPRAPVGHTQSKGITSWPHHWPPFVRGASATKGARSRCARTAATTRARRARLCCAAGAGPAEPALPDRADPGQAGRLRRDLSGVRSHPASQNRGQRNTARASCIARAGVWRKTTPRRCAGSSKPPRRIMSERKKSYDGSINKPLDRLVCCASKRPSTANTVIRLTH